MNSDRDRIVRISSKDYKLAQILLQETGNPPLQGVVFLESSEQFAGAGLNRDVKNVEMAIRGMIRWAALNQLGYKEEYWLDFKNRTISLSPDKLIYQQISYGKGEKPLVDPNIIGLLSE